MTFCLLAANLLLVKLEVSCDLVGSSLMPLSSISGTVA